MTRNGPPKGADAIPGEGDQEQDTAPDVFALPLRDHEMPAWVAGVLTAAQVERGNPVWRWKRVVWRVAMAAPAKAVAQYLAERCSDSQPWAWPRLETICADTGYRSRHAVIRAVAELERLGLLRVWRQKSDRTKRQENNVYELAWPAEPVPLTETQTRVHETHPDGARDAPGVVHETHPGRVHETRRKVPYKALNEGSYQDADSRLSALTGERDASQEQDAIKSRALAHFARHGVGRDDVIRMVDTLRADDIGDTVIDEAVGQCINADARSLRYLERVAGDWIEQRTGGRERARAAAAEAVE